MSTIYRVYMVVGPTAIITNILVMAIVLSKKLLRERQLLLVRLETNDLRPLTYPFHKL